MKRRPAPAAEPAGRLRADWHFPTEIRFGAGRAAEIPGICRQLGFRQPLLVTDPGLTRRPLFRRLMAANRAGHVETTVFSKVLPDPDVGCIAEGARTYQEGGHDGIIALGGGSALDAGKAIALCTAVGRRRLWDFVYRNNAPPPPVRTGTIPAVVAVPTTAGTGSEVNGAAVITDPADRRKRSLFCPELLPRIVVADPALTRAPNAQLTAATGMDALSHNLEALCAPEFNPILDAVALQGMRFAADWLAAAFRAPRAIRARAYTMAASIMGAVAFQKGLGAMHAMAHAVGALFKTHHGRTVAAVMPYVLHFNRRRIEEKMAVAARFLDLPRHDHREMVNWTLTLRSELQMPDTLADLGVRMEHLPDLVDRALADANAPTNPVPLDREKMTVLFRWAVRGKR